jgi:hypothetical protein
MARNWQQVGNKFADPKIAITHRIFCDQAGRVRRSDGGEFVKEIRLEAVRGTVSGLLSRTFG